MAFKTFRIPVSHGDAFETELNTFLRTHRVLNVDRQFVSCGEQSFWAFNIDYLDSGGLPAPASQASHRAKVDYREILTPDEFSLFARLRDLRKEIAQAESVPVYMVFTNEQLAQIVQKRVNSKVELEQIDGLGDARVEKYGDRVVEFLSRFTKTPMACASNRNGQP